MNDLRSQYLQIGTLRHRHQRRPSCHLRQLANTNTDNNNSVSIWPHSYRTNGGVCNFVSFSTSAVPSGICLHYLSEDHPKTTFSLNSCCKQEGVFQFITGICIICFLCVFSQQYFLKYTKQKTWGKNCHLFINNIDVGPVSI